MLRVECSCSSDAAEEGMTEEPNTTVAGVSRWSQTEISMEQDVETMPTATFRVYQDNATKFQHNKKLTE
ncbi:hypothetical protein AK812_SmicGene2005, partial [Symbiodinium microadriaticum]